MSKLKYYRLKKGYTQKRMAQHLGKTESAYCLMESGKRRISMEDAKIISSILQISLDEFFCLIH